GLGARGSGHLIATAIEHPSVLEPIRDLERRGFRVTVVNPDANGVVPAGRVLDAIRPETALVAMMLVNNETGVIQPVAELSAVVRARGIHVHCDAVQAAGKIPLDVELLEADTVAIAAHKLHGPKGIGALYVRKGVTLQPYLAGGAQERRRRAGTENVPLAAGFGRAAAIAATLDHVPELTRRRDELERRILHAFPDAILNGAGANRVANTTSVSFRGHDAEGIVIGLDLEGVAVSTGSACSSGRVEPSHVLIAMGISEEDAQSSVRISLSRFTTDEEIDRAFALLTQLVPKNRRLSALVK
ncbi:MAG TPA: cysteine desulfurase family protein, partial [Thermoanaerobaculia bacterium]